jgi:hypothetical protein
MRTLLALSLSLVALFGAAGPSLAVTALEADQHNALVSTLTAQGIKIALDADLCREKSLAGFYHSPTKTMVICNGGSTQMTEYNLDTLRHESIHVAQDCRNGIKGDHNLQRIMKPGMVEQLANSTGVSLANIRRVYRSNGADDHTILLEYEAFTGAASMSADTIAEALRIVCNVSK